MAVFSVDSDAVLSATTVVRGTVDRLEAEASALLGQLTQLQASWTGTASLTFQSVVDDWRATQRQVEATLSAIHVALGAAGRQYADVEQTAIGMFR
ncbi:MAG: WXG100 family type VII secretion target [Actinobacteria bacterium]|nr:WXG100 family type VII secretion target [Actinomycetota bacterium]